MATHLFMNDAFSNRLLQWFDLHGRHDLPWQQPRTPYRVWVSEIMLQQTQVTTVIGYFERFMARFPTVASLAQAAQDDVLHLWTGLGYYARARNLHRAAQQVVDQHDGELPITVDALMSLPGIGRSTAGAILAQSHGQPVAILDGNVKRVLTRYHGISGWPGKRDIEKQLWHWAEHHTPNARVADYTQAIMDLGATLCTRRKPRCGECPQADHCVALQQDAVDDYPTRKTPRTLPVRQATWWLLTDPQGQVLLEQRPQRGLWGGLWCPPQSDSDERTGLDDLLKQRQLDALGPTRKLSPFRHTFSHFHLEVQPVQIVVASNALAEPSPEQRWVNPQAPGTLGLAMPVKALLAGLHSGQHALQL